MKQISGNSLETLKKCLSFLKDNNHEGFDAEVKKLGNLSAMVQKDWLLESPKIGNFLYSPLAKNKVEINVFSVIISAFANSEKISSPDLLKFIVLADCIDPLGPAFIAHGKKAPVLKTNFEMMMSIDRLHLDRFLRQAKSAGMIDGRKEQYEAILDKVVHSQLSDSDKCTLDRLGRKAIWKNLLICAFNDILPSESLMRSSNPSNPSNPSNGTEGQGHASLKFSYPWKMPPVSLTDDLQSSSVKGRLTPMEVGIPLLAFAATTNGASILVSSFLAKGHEVNQSNPDNKITALHIAAWRGDIKCAYCLLAAGANMDAKDSMGRTPTQYLELQKGESEDKKIKTMQEFKALFDSKRALNEIDNLMNTLTNSAKSEI